MLKVVFGVAVTSGIYKTVIIQKRCGIFNALEMLAGTGEY